MEIETSHYIPQDLRAIAGWEMTNRADSGKKVTQISKELNISYSHLYNLEKKYQCDPTMADAERLGRPPKIDERSERRMLRSVRTRPFEKATVLTREYNLGIEEESKVSVTRFREIACQNNLAARRPSHKPFLKEDHIANRLAFAQQYVDRDMRFWRNALFADESRIEVRPSDKRILVRRPDGQRYSKDLSQLGRMVVNQQCFGGVFRGLDKEY